MKLNMPLNAATDEVKYLSKKIKGYHGDSWYEFISLSANKSFTKSRLGREFLKELFNVN
jgi:hypothetical protein